MRAVLAGATVAWSARTARGEVSMTLSRLSK